MIIIIDREIPSHRNRQSGRIGVPKNFFRKNLFLENAFLGVFGVAEHESDIIFSIWGACTKIRQLLPRKCQLLLIWFLRYFSVKIGSFWTNWAYKYIWKCYSISSWSFVVFSHINSHFILISKSWHFRGTRWRILIQTPHIEKLMSDSCSSISKETHFQEINFSKKKLFLGPQFSLIFSIWWYEATGTGK